MILYDVVSKDITHRLKIIILDIEMVNDKKKELETKI